MSPSTPSAERARARRRRPPDADDRARRALAAQQAAADTSRRVLERAATERDGAWRSAADENRRRALTLLAVPFLPGVVLLLLALVALPLLVVGLFLLLAWAVAAVTLWRRAHRGFASRLGARRVEEAVADDVVEAGSAARFADVTESLCAALGLPLPRLGILADPSFNAVSSGVGESAFVVCTSGLLGALERIELEAVVAHELVHLKRLDTLTGGLSAALLRGGSLPGSSGLATWLEGRERELLSDLAAVTVTRYPPALIHALQTASSAPAGTIPRSLPPRLVEETGSSWLVSLRPFGFDLDERLEVLVEL